MNKTATQEALESIATEAGAPERQGEVRELPPSQLPAVRQERAPAKPRNPAPSKYPKSVALLINAISKEIGIIQKQGMNEFQKYRYAKWEDILEKLSPLLAEHGLVIDQTEIQGGLVGENDKGSSLREVYEFRIINANDGEVWGPTRVPSSQRFMDQKGIVDDKATSKCQTQAYKNFCVKIFQIRTDDFVDSDAHSVLPKKDARDVYAKLQAEIDGQTSLVALGTWGKENAERIRVLPNDWQNILKDRFAEKRGDLENQAREFDEKYDEETGELKSAAPSAEKAAPATPSPPATVGAADSLDEEWLLANARVFAARGKEAMNAFFKEQTKEAKAIMRAHKPELEALYPKGD